MRRREGEGAMRAASGAVAVATSLAVPSAALAQERPYEWGWGMHPMWGLWGAWGLGMALMMVVVWGVVIVAIVLGANACVYLGGVMLVFLTLWRITSSPAGRWLGGLGYAALAGLTWLVLALGTLVLFNR